MRDRLIVEKTPELLTRALHSKMTDMLDSRNNNGDRGISIQRISSMFDETTGEPILLHEKRLRRPHDTGFRPKRVVYPLAPEAIHHGVIDRRAQESLFPVDGGIRMFGPLSDIPATNALLCMDEQTADIITDIESTNVLKADFESIEGTEADRADRERAEDVIALRGEIGQYRVQLNQKKNQICSYHGDLRSLTDMEFERRLLQPSETEGIVERYLVQEYLDIKEAINERAERIQALSGAVFQDAQDRLHLDVSDMPIFDFRSGVGWNFGD